MKNNYISGIIGAIIGGLIPVFALALCYIFIELTPLILSFFIPFGALIGYQLFNATIDKKIITIIYTITIIMTICLIFIVIPVVYLFLSNAHITFQNVINLIRGDVLYALLEDFVLAFIFAMSGTYIVVSKTKKQLNEGAHKIDLKKEIISKEEKEKIAKFFIEKSATSKDFSLEEDILLNSLSIDKDSLMYLVNSGFIKKTGKRYYLNIKYNKQKKIGTIILIVFVFIISVLVTYYILDKNNDDYVYEEKNEEKEKTEALQLYYEKLEGYKKYRNEENNGYYFILGEEETFENGYIEIVSENDANFSDFDTLKSDLKEAFKDENLIYEEDYFNNFDKRTLYYEFESEGYYVYIYYIFNDKKYAVVESAFPIGEKENKIKIDSRKIADSIHW